MKNPTTPDDDPPIAGRLDRRAKRTAQVVFRLPENIKTALEDRARKDETSVTKTIVNFCYVGLQASSSNAWATRRRRAA